MNDLPAYLLLTLATVFVFLLTVDRTRLPDYLPVYFFAATINLVGDQLMSETLKLMEYRPPVISEHVTSTILALGFYPLLAILMFEYARRHSIIAAVSIWSIGSWLLIELPFVMMGFLVYRKWSMAASLFFWFADYAAIALFQHVMEARNRTRLVR